MMRRLYLFAPPLLLSLVVALLIGQAQADFALLKPSVSSNAQATEPTDTAATPASPSITAILGGNLFGNIDITPQGKSAEAPVELVETRLNIQLLGTFTHSDALQASALIADGSKRTKRYFVHDQIPGNAELVAVHKAHVVLRRNGRDELLRFPRLSERQTGNNRVAVTAASHPASQQTTASHTVTTSSPARNSLKQRLGKLRLRNSQ